jgi:hypothetical protein
MGVPPLGLGDYLKIGTPAEIPPAWCGKRHGPTGNRRSRREKRRRFPPLHPHVSAHHPALRRQLQQLIPRRPLRLHRHAARRPPSGNHGDDPRTRQRMGGLRGRPHDLLQDRSRGPLLGWRAGPGARFPRRRLPARLGLHRQSLLQTVLPREHRPGRHVRRPTISVSLPEAKLYAPAIAGALPPSPPHFYAEYGPDYNERYQWRFPPTTGAYEVLPEDIVKGASITQTRVKDWWAKDRKYYNTVSIRTNSSTPWCATNPRPSNCSAPASSTPS